MATGPGDLLELQKANLAAVQGLGQAWLDSAERLLTLNLTAARETFKESSEAALSLAEVRDPQEFFALLATTVQPTLEKLVGYARHVLAIANDASDSVGQVVQSQVEQGNQSFHELLELAVRNGPAGTEPAVSLIKNVVAAANTAFDAAAKATRQASDWAESSFTAAATATLQAAAAANESVSPKARKVA